MYDESKELPVPSLIDSFDPFDDFTLVPQDGEELYEGVDYTLTLDFQMSVLGDGAN